LKNIYNRSGEVMAENKCQCANCTCVKEMFVDAKEKRLGVKEVYDFLFELYKEKRLTVYMSEFPFESFWDEIMKEVYFSYRAYLKCPQCNRVFYMGVCVRGTPVYDVLYTMPDKAQFKSMCIRDGKRFYEEV